MPVYASGLKAALLRLFGATIGNGVIFKPGLKITFPWKLTVGDSVWLGEEAWILNLAPVVIEDNVCISQRAFICTGNHDYSDPAFGLIVRPVRICEGAWLGASSFVGPGVTVCRNAVLCACSLATHDLLEDMVYQGTPAKAVRVRWK